jgi:uncharacterized iron-regulated protein
MRAIVCSLCIFFSLQPCFAQLSLFKMYDAKGRELSLKKLQKELKDADIVFFGELHNHSVAHWLELQVLKTMAASERTLSLGMEMFESDDQLIIDEYFSGLIQERHFLKEAKLWDNYQTDYRPIVAFALSKQIPLIATNIPQRYANLVYRKGLDALEQLTPEALSYMCPLPFPVDFSLSTHESMIKMMEGHGNHGGQHLVLAQAIKDATMAHFILKNLTDRMLHINGSFHSVQHEGIVWYIRQQRPDLKILTIHTEEHHDLSQLNPELKVKADIIILLAEDAIKSY